MQAPALPQRVVSTLQHSTWKRLLVINVRYSCCQFSTPTKAIPTTPAHGTSVLPPAVALRKYVTLYALDWVIGFRFAVSNKKLFSCDFLGFSSGVDGVPFCDVTYCDP